MNLHKARAIAAMAQSRHQYNLGVLSMLGKAQLAMEHQLAAAVVDSLIGERHAVDASADLAARLDPVSPAVQRLQHKLDEAIARQSASWEQIQRLIDLALKAIAANERRAAR